jgi:hypothetical protein
MGGRPKLPTGTTGALSEMAAAMDLMMRGYEVFRALSPTCSCDLIAAKPGASALRIEVRTGQISHITGRTSFPRNGKGKDKRDESVLDHYAVVVYIGAIPHVTYEPPLPEGEALA